jgi:hypothetical protein
LKFIILIIAALSLFTSLSAQAEWSKQFDIEYLMGDGDNRTSARQAALEQLKVKASGEAGTYVQSTTTMRTGSELTENIQLIGAAMVKVSDIKDKLTVNQNGQAVLRVTAKATIDESELFKRVEALRQDREKARQIKLLQVENDELFQELKKIRGALISNLDASRTAELISQQDTAIRRLTSNSLTVTQVFERGTLLQLASKNTDAFTRAKLELDEQLFAPLLKTPISATIESVEEAGNGDYVALVRVGWVINVKNISPILSRYLNVGKFSSKINEDEYEKNEHNLYMQEYSNIESKGPNVISEKLYNYLSTKGVDLKLTLVGRTVTLPVLYSGNSFTDICGYYGTLRGVKKEYICIVSQPFGYSRVHSFDSKLTNPIRIPLTREEAERATRVDASFIFNNELIQQGAAR